MICIMIIAYNEAEYVDLSVQSIRTFADVDDISVIVVDMGSTDGLRDWASGQTDITYVYMDEEDCSYGSAFNEVKEALHISGDVLLLQGGFLLTRNSLSNMLAALHEEEGIGAVGPMSNQFQFYQRARDIRDYEEAALWTSVSHREYSKRVIGLCNGAVLFKGEALRQLGGFEENMAREDYVVKDYCLRMIMHDWKIKVCGDSLVWGICDGGRRREADPMEAKKLEQKWGMHYFNAAYNAKVIEMVKEEKDADIGILEVGCDCGATLLEIRNQFPNARVYGCEINENAAQIAAHFAEVTVNNIEEQNLAYGPEMFDYIIFGDVLEHLSEPLKTIQYCRTFLKKSGHIIASIPNLMHISVVEELLLRGNFTYTETGLLDRSHIHLFTFNEIVRMFQAAGFELDDMKITSIPISREQEALIGQLLSMKGAEVSRFMYEAFQYLIYARIPGEKKLRA